MKALICHAPEDLRIDAQEEELPGPGQLQVRVAFGGICGSDLHYYQHGGFGTIRIQQPMVLGHEVAGQVEAVGDAVQGLATLKAFGQSRTYGAMLAERSRQLYRSTMGVLAATHRGRWQDQAIRLLSLLGAWFGLARSNLAFRLLLLRHRCRRLGTARHSVVRGFRRLPGGSAAAWATLLRGESRAALARRAISAASIMAAGSR